MDLGSKCRLDIGGIPAVLGAPGLASVGNEKRPDHPPAEALTGAGAIDSLHTQEGAEPT